MKTGILGYGKLKKCPVYVYFNLYAILSCLTTITMQMYSSESFRKSIRILSKRGTNTKVQSIC